MDFRFPFDELTTSDKKKLLALSAEWSKRADSTIQYKLNAGKYVGTYNTSKLWDITDESDLIFLKYLCDNPVVVQENLKLFVAQMAVALKKDSDNCGSHTVAVELDFIINYDIKYRMGDELNGEA